MSHPKELIQLVAAAVAVSYPTDAGYEFVFEKMLPGTRFMPDILVTKDGRNVCAVEIGYTRPEKLTAYRQQLGIPDVRWYDKEGTLHADVTEKVVRVSVVTSPACGVYVYEILGRVRCIECPETSSARPVPESVIDRYISRFGLDAYDLRSQEIEDEECDDVHSLVVTDYQRVWVFSYCDKCGRNWFMEDPEDWTLLEEDFAGTPREIGLRIGGRVELSWEAACKVVSDRYGLVLEYMAGGPLTAYTARTCREAKSLVYSALEKWRA